MQNPYGLREQKESTTQDPHGRDPGLSVSSLRAMVAAEVQVSGGQVTTNFAFWKHHLGHRMEDGLDVGKCVHPIGDCGSTPSGLD